MRILIVVLSAVVSCQVGALPARGQGAKGQDDAFAQARRLGRGINLGNALEAPKEGAWGVTLEAGYFPAIKKAGFQSVRLPVKWSAHAGRSAPYAIEGKFFERVDWAVDQALKAGLAVVVNVHHYDEMMAEPERHEARLVALWGQIAARYKGRSGLVYFELLNEPHGKLTDERWNALVPRLLKVVRATNPTRAVIVGPGQWNNVGRLEKLRLPAGDRHLIGTFHYYSPFEFTHQGASWVKGSERWKGRKWEGTEKERAAVRADFAKAAAWAKREKRPLYLGEFGAYSAADRASRERWTAAVAREAERSGFAWSYWEFCSGFGAYDAKAKAWREGLLGALVPR